MNGLFRVYRDAQNPQDIHFEQLELSAAEQIPEDQLALRDEVDRAVTVIRMLFKDDASQFEEYFRPLLALAQLGLVGQSANPRLALRALTTLKEQAVSREGGRIKNEYMKKLGMLSAIFGIPAICLGSMVYVFAPSMQKLTSFLFLWAGCMVGVWLSFGARKITLRFDELSVLEKDRLSPVVRLFFAGLLTVAIGLLLSEGAVVLKLGNLSTESFSSNISTALIVGVFCGMSEQALSSKVSQHASEFLKLK